MDADMVLDSSMSLDLTMACGGRTGSSHQAVPYHPLISRPIPLSCVHMGLLLFFPTLSGTRASCVLGVDCPSLSLFFFKVRIYWNSLADP